jgi:hypothetical protein
MHRSLLLFAGLPLVAGLGIAAVDDGATPLAKTGRVNVTAQCVNGDVRGNVAPSSLRIAQDDDVEWQIHETGRVDSIRVYPKKSNRWPFDSNKRKGRRNDPATASDMEPDQAGETYEYNVEVWCTDNHGAKLHQEIDPDIIIEDEASR